MLVQGAIIPPRTVIEAVAEIVRSVDTSDAPAEPPPPAKGIRRRFGGRQVHTTASPTTVPAELDYLPIAGFGNVTSSDAHRIAEAVTAAAASWAAPTVYFAGGTALDFPGDRCVWAKLEGDVSSLMAIARGLPQSVERLGFFVDRRRFRAMMSLATITDATTVPHLQAVIDALDEFRGEEWTIDHVTLTRDAFVAGRSESAEFHRVPLRHIQA